MLRDPQGDGGPLLQDTEPGPGCPGNLRAAGESTSLVPEVDQESVICLLSFLLLISPSMVF